MDIINEDLEEEVLTGRILRKAVEGSTTSKVRIKHAIDAYGAYVQI